MSALHALAWGWIDPPVKVKKGISKDADRIRCLVNEETAPFGLRIKWCTFNWVGYEIWLVRCGSMVVFSGSYLKCCRFIVKVINTIDYLKEKTK